MKFITFHGFIDTFEKFVSQTLVLKFHVLCWSLFLIAVGNYSFVCLEIQLPVCKHSASELRSAKPASRCRMGPS